MINRNLIRTRIVQIVYSWYQNSNNNLRNAEKELLMGFQKSYDLYFYLLLLMVEITDMYETRLETKKNKFLPTEKDLNPNTALINNQFIKYLKENKGFVEFLKERPLSWENQESFLRGLLDEILASEHYAEYSKQNNHTFDEDKEFWRKSFKKYIYLNEQLDDILEDESIFWNDDVETIQTFVLKSIKQYDTQKGINQPLLPMFKDEDDRQFALELLRATITNKDEYKKLIEKHTDKWDFERIATIDLLIMQVAVAEIINFPNIPTTVTFNEYIDIAKTYSTPKSGIFINGILDAIVNDLKKNNVIFKN